MDRPVDRHVRARRIAKRAAIPVVAVGAAVLILTGLAGWIAPSIRRRDIRTAVVDRGSVEATVTASGFVVPEYEHVITSPVETRVTRIILTPGAQLRAGQPILELDTGETTIAIQKLDDRIALKENERDRARLDAARRQAALRTQREIKALESATRDYEAERNRMHFAEGLFSRDAVRAAEDQAAMARLELREIDESLANLAESLQKEIEGLDLEIAILRKDRAEEARRLALASAVSDRSGVLTWVVPKEGTAVRKGDELARVADLGSFRVQATVSDVHASRVAAGLPVIVQTGSHRFGGRITRVRPTVENGIVTFEAALDDKSNPVLRDNLRVDVYVVTDRAEHALRVARGPYMTPDGTHAVYVVRGKAAVRAPVRFGLTNVDYYQVLEGLKEGDEVIVSDMSPYVHAKEVKLR